LNTRTGSPTQPSFLIQPLHCFSKLVSGRCGGTIRCRRFKSRKDCAGRKLGDIRRLACFQVRKVRQEAAVAEQAPEIDPRKGKLVDAKDGSLFDLKRDSVEVIADAIVANVAPGRAEAIARGVLKRIGKKACTR